MDGLAEKLRRLGSAAKASSRVAEDDREARDDAIEEAKLADWSVREIAQSVGLVPSRVQDIVIARAARRQRIHVA